MGTIVVDGLAWSGRDEVSRGLAQTLGWPVVGPQELATEAERLGFDGEEFLMRLERPYTLRERFADLMAYVGLGNPGMPGILMGLSPGIPSKDGTSSYLPLTAYRMQTLLRQVVRAVMGRGPAVLVGSGTQGIMQGIDGVLKVFLVGSQGARATRAMQGLEVGWHEAVRHVAEVDRGRKAFMKQLLGLRWDDPSGYDLVLDTGALGAGAATSLVLATLGDTRPARLEDGLLDSL